MVITLPDESSILLDDAADAGESIGITDPDVGVVMDASGDN
jgi:hypothetical protein